MQRRLVAREINPDVLINIPPPHFGAEKRRACAFCCILLFASPTCLCVCVFVPRAHEDTGRTDKKKCANKHASHITRELPLAWLLIKPAAPIRDYKD